MSRLRRHVPALLLLGLALASLLLGFRTESDSGPEQASLAENYFFRDARMTLAGEDGRSALVVTSGSAVRSLTGTALSLEPVSIRRSGPQAWELVADSAEMPGENADIVAQGGLRMTFGPAGTGPRRLGAPRSRPTERASRSPETSTSTSPKEGRADRPSSANT